MTPPGGWRLGALYGPSEVDLGGDALSLDAFGRLLQDPPAGEVVIDLAERAPGQYEGCLGSLVVIPGVWPVAIRHDSATLTVEGGHEELATLGRSIEWFAAYGDPDDPFAQMHEEQLPSPDWASPPHIADEAVPLILSFL